jgi:purine-binding chemotaxis protein CheW
MENGAASEGKTAGLFLVFYLDDQLYGVPVDRAREIIPLVEITKVPKAPPLITGVINLRGTIVPIVDLRKKLKLKAREPDDRTCLVIVESPARLFGFSADRVTDCLEIADIGHPDDSDIDLPGEKKLVGGIGQHPDGIIVLLEPNSLFTPSELKAMKAL